jgi:phage-related protein
MENKRVIVRFYQTDTGNEPVRDWLKALNPEDRKIIGIDVKTVEYGWPIGMPTCRSMGNKLYEVRSNLTSHRIARVLFYVHENQMVLLHGFIKKTQKTSKHDLELAVERKRKLEAQQ